MIRIVKVYAWKVDYDYINLKVNPIIVLLEGPR